MILETKNLRLEFNKENLEICNIFYKNEKIIKSITFFDEFHKDLSQLLIDYKYISPISKIIKQLNWNFNYESKRKEAIIYANAKYIKDKLILNINITFIVKENEIIIKILNNSNQKIFYGISTIFNGGNSKIKLPYELKGTNFIQMNHGDNVSLKSKNFICEIFSTFLNIKKEDSKNVIFSPIVYDSQRKVLKSWRVSHNNKNFNAINLKFSKN